ncbi:hypothetical protein LTR32_006941 [Rachicladosporium monterosium]|uniref:Uncharacterized protein n=1 Tax=Rachicladosporium monterosium TaxID=1507873 RepID=A0ABR0KZE9_9PEZI|nr:hypothetical protein LTR32_006941 [Rachicladosporium monterosium]
MSFVRILCAVHVETLAQVELEARRTDDIRRGEHPTDIGKSLWKGTGIEGQAFEELGCKISGTAISAAKQDDDGCQVLCCGRESAVQQMY